VLGLETNELLLVVFLSVLITAFGWLPRVGEALGEWLGPKEKRKPGRSSTPPPPAGPADSG